MVKYTDAYAYLSSLCKQRQYIAVSESIETEHKDIKLKLLFRGVGWYKICNMSATVLYNLSFESHPCGQTHEYNHSNAKECDETTPFNSVRCRSQVRR